MKRSDLSTFNQWLDGFVGGRSTPPHTPPPDPTLHHVQSAARQLHDLAGHAEGMPVPHSLPPTWEEFMHAEHLEPSPRITRSGAFPQRASRTIGGGLAGPLNALNSRPARYASNAIVTAIVLAVLLAGGWRAAQHYNPGPPEELATIPFGAFLQDEATPEAPADLPVAADCTIEPLTVDEVLWYITDRDAARKTSPDAEPLAYFPYPDPATPPATNVPFGPADHEDLAQMVTTQRMWMACVLADSPFQVWATVNPEVIGRVLPYSFPPFTSEEEARAVLAALEAGTHEPTPPYDSYLGILGSSCFDVAVISSDPERSYGQEVVVPVPEGTESRYGYYVVDTLWIDGSLEPGFATPASTDQLEAAFLDAGAFTFLWNDARQAWLLDSWPNCG